MISVESAIAFARAGREQFLQRYKDFLAIPSISTSPEHRPDVQRAADWLVAELTRLNVSRVELMPGTVHPIVYAERCEAPGKPTILVYGHYDVQPADPLSEWVSDPFVPTVRGDNLHARGASDMKGSLIAFLGALEAVTKQGAPPVNIKFLLEGEEEIGSPSLPGFIESHRELLKADFALNGDGMTHSADVPSICYALRGLAYFEIEVRGPRHDLHSGSFGGVVHNPVQVLCELIAGMHDADGRVTLPGFYDTVRPLDAEERATLARIPFTDEDWKAMTGVPALWGEKGYTAVERVGARPTIEINGLIGGFTDKGAKTIIPARATAKVSTRLVADQDPAAIHGQLVAYMRAHAPDTVTWEVREHSRGPGAIMDRHSPAMRAALDALRETFGAEPLFEREGGSVPVVGMMRSF